MTFLKRCSVTHSRRSLYRGPRVVPSKLMQGTHHDTSLFHNGHFKSRDSDIWVVSASKSGTTWNQQILRELMFGADDNLKPLTTKYMTDLSPWVAMAYRLSPNYIARVLESQSHRRVLKSHEPIEALPFNAKNKYIVVVRDYRDVIWSAYNHYASQKWWVRWMHNSPKRYTKKALPKLPANYSTTDFFEQMTLEGDQFGNPDGAWLWSPLWVVGSWMDAVRTNPSLKDSIMFVHYMDLCRDPVAEIKRVADFIGVEASNERLLEIKEKTTLEAMRNLKDILGVGTGFFKEGNASFFKKGGSRKDDWQPHLTDAHLGRYHLLAESYMHEDDIQFMETTERLVCFCAPKSLENLLHC